MKKEGRSKFQQFCGSELCNSNSNFVAPHLFTFFFACLACCATARTRDGTLTSTTVVGSNSSAPLRTTISGGFSAA